MQPAPLNPNPPTAVSISLANSAAFSPLCEAINSYNAASAVAEVPKAEAQSSLNVQSLNDQHAEILQLSGLAVAEVPVTARSLVGAHVALRITDAAKFTSFLDSLSPDAVVGTVLEAHLRPLPNLLATAVRSISDLADPSDHTLRVLASLNPLVKHYDRLGITDACTMLRPYAEKLKEKLLAEYLLVDRLDLLMEPGVGFYPGDRKFDSFPSTVAAKWKQALDTLDVLDKKEAARELHGTVARHLEAIVSSARANIKKVLFERRDEVAQILDSVHAKLLPQCTTTNTVHASDAAPLKEALSGLQFRTAPPHLIGMRDLYYKELFQEQRIAANATHNSDGRLLAHACAAPAHIQGEAEILTFAIEPTVRGLGLEERLLTELETALRKMEYSAMRITLAGSDPALAIIKRHYGQSAQVVGSYGDDQRVLRIDFSASA